MGHLHWFTRAVPSTLQSIYNEVRKRFRLMMVERLTEEHRRPFRPSCRSCFFCFFFVKQLISRTGIIYIEAM
ncbi:hypothetical protein Hanom_Chr13g01214141 [Helianthus anomalus]